MERVQQEQSKVRQDPGQAGWQRGEDPHQPLLPFMSPLGQAAGSPEAATGLGPHRRGEDRGRY